jgi:CheY-like chemotaxis protein
MNEPVLSGRRIIIVEDDYYQAYDTKQVLEQAGAQIVAVTASAPDLDALLAQGAIDAGLLDINLGHTLSLDFARSLRGHGIPFVFLTGYDARMVPDNLSDIPCLSKPADHAALLCALQRIVTGGSK